MRLPGDRPQRHDERIDADVDGPLAALDGQSAASSPIPRIT